MASNSNGRWKTGELAMSFQRKQSCSLIWFGVMRAACLSVRRAAQRRRTSPPAMTSMRLPTHLLVKLSHLFMYCHELNCRHVVKIANVKSKLRVMQVSNRTQMAMFGTIPPYDPNYTWRILSKLSMAFGLLSVTCAVCRRQSVNKTAVLN